MGIGAGSRARLMTISFCHFSPENIKPYPLNLRQAVLLDGVRSQCIQKTVGPLEGMHASAKIFQAQTILRDFQGLRSRRSQNLKNLGCC